MSATSTTRANRPPKEKTTKTQPLPPQNVKDTSNKIKATAEQLRLAQMISDKRGQDDPDIPQKVEQLMDLTQKSHDEVAIALHDCDNDVYRASIMLLEGDTDQGEWQETGKKKKRSAPTVNSQHSEQTNSKPDYPKSENREKSSDREVKEIRSESSSRGGRRRDDGPPRFQRGGKSWRGKENEENERNRNEKGRDRGENRENNRERSYERGRGRGRGGRGRGRGGGGRSGGGSGFNRNSNKGGFDSGPQIDTWSNDQAIVNKEKAWDSMGTEDWNDDAWTGSLSESTVFTASSIGGPITSVDPPPGLSDAASEPFGQNGSLGPNNSLNQTAPMGHNNTIGQSGAIGQSAPLGQTGVIGQSTSLGQAVSLSQSNALGQTSSLGQSNSLGAVTTLGQSLDLSALLQQKPTNDVSDMNSVQQSSPPALTPSQFSKQASDVLKSMVGIGTSSSSLSSNTQPQQIPNAMTPPSSLSSVASTSLPTPSSLSSVPITPPQSQGQISNQQRPKPARSKLPPPSKIPASAVEMPGHMATSVDVQFGFVADFGATTDHASIQNSFSSNTVSTTGSAITNHLPLSSQPSDQSATTVSLMSSITPPKTSLASMDQSNSRTSMFTGSANSTPTKDFTQAGMNKPSGISPPEPIPFPSSQSDRSKTSPLLSSQRQGQTGSLSSTDPVTTFSQSSYSTTYQPSRYSHKSSGLTTSGYTHGTNSMSSHQSGLSSQMPTTTFQSSQNQYQSQYQPSSFQGQTGFPTGPVQGALYQSSNQPSYGGQSGSTYRDSQTGSSYASGQSGPSFPTSQSGSYPSTHSQSSFTSGQTGSAYPTSQSGSSTYPTSQSSAYPSAQTGSSYQTSQSGSAYPSTQTYSNSSQSASSYQSSQTNSYQAGTAGPSTYSTNLPSGNSYQSGSPLPQAGSGYQSGQSGSTYQPSVSQSSSSYQRDSQPSLGHQQNQTYGSHNNYSSTSHQSTLQTSPVGSSKLSESLSKMNVKDSNMDQTPTPYDTTTASTTAAAASLSSTTTTTSSSLASGTVSVSTALGLTPTTSSVTSASTNAKSSSLTNTSGKAPPNLPPGVPPVLGHNFIMSQHMPAYFGLTPQQPLYCNNYEDLQVLQQRLPLVSGTKQIQLPGYYDATLPFQPPTSIAGNDQRTLGNVPYSGADGKLSRVDAQSPVQGSQASQQQPSQSAHQQTYINTATFPPGYGYYITQAGMLPGNFPYTPTMFPQQVPPVTNAAHGSTTATTQFQKPAGYASHGYGSAGYEDLAGQDFSKTAYGAVSQTQNKVSATTGIKGIAVTTGTSDIPASVYTKSHAQSFDKQGFHGGTPPPFNLPVPSGTQAGPMGAPTTPYNPYMAAMLPHQPPSQMLHHPLQQDSTGSTRGSQQSSSQPKPTAGSKSYSTGYWNA